MKTVYDIYKFIDSFAPFKSAFDYDNCGILVGDKDTKITKALLSLDITDKTAMEAKNRGAQLIISHHPVIFDPLKNVDSNTPVFYLVQNGISAICAHTNLDVSESFGTNTCFAEKLELKNIKGMDKDNKGIPQWFLGELEKAYSADEFARFVKEKLSCNYVKYNGSSKKIQHVGICTGAAAEYFESASLYSEAYVSGEVKQHQFVKAQNMDFTLIDAGHYETEIIVIEPLSKKLSLAFSDIEFMISKEETALRYI